MADPPDSTAPRPRSALSAGGPAPASGLPAARGTLGVPLPGAAKRPARPPLVLLVGDGEATSDGLAAALKQRGLAVMTSPAERAVAAAVARAPDLVMLLGDAAQEGGQRVIKTLAGRATTARLPVAVLEDGDAASLDRRLRALRSGAIAVIERQASVDAMAARIGDLAWRVTDHSTRTAAGVEVTLDDLTAVIRKELGLLVPDDTGQMVAAPGREMAEAIQVFVERIRALVQRGDVEGARAALAARPPQMRIDAAMLADLDDGATLALRGARVLLVHDDPSRADALAQELRARGSVVVVSGRSERGLIRGRELDPEVVLLDSGSVVGPGLDVAQLLARDVRLRWASVLVVSWDEIWPAGVKVPRMSVIAARVAPHRAPEREIADRVVEEARFDLDVERIGPSRILRALAMAPHVLGVTALEDLEQLRVDLANGLVAGATADGLEGLPALAKMLEMSTGVLRIERRRAPSTANVFLPVEDALAMAGRENAGGRLSSPPPSATTPGALSAPDEPDAPPVAELDAPFAGVASRTLLVGGPLANRLASDDDDTTEVNLGHIDRVARPEAGEHLMPPPRAEDPIGGGLAALLEPESVMPMPRMRPRPHAAGEPAAHAPPAAPKRAGVSTLVGVAPPEASAAALGAAAAGKASEEITSGAVAPDTHDAHEPAFAEITAVDAEPIVAAPATIDAAPTGAEVVAEPPVAGPPVSELPVSEPPVAALPSAAPPAAIHAPFPAPAVALPPTPVGQPPGARRSRAPIALAGGVLLLGVGALVAWRFVVPLYAEQASTLAPVAPLPPTPTTDAPPVVHPSSQAGPVQHAATVTQPEAGEVAALVDAGPPAALPPVAVAPALVADRGAADAGPANAPALAAAEAQTLATALDQVLADAAADPDAECERLVDEARDTADPARAAALLLRAAELSARNPHPVEALARLYLRTGNSAGAVEWAGKLVALRRRRASFRVLLGDARRAAGNAAGAQSAYQEALEIDPNDADARQRLGP